MMRLERFGPAAAEMARSTRVAWAPSVTRRILRSRWFLGAVTGFVVIGGTGAVVEQRVRYDAHVAAWGQRGAVVLVETAVDSGAEVGGAFVVEQRPAAMIPDGALVELPPRDALAKFDLYPGEIVLAERIAANGGLDAASPDAEPKRAVTVAIDGPAALVEVGHLVDLWSTDPITLSATKVVSNVVVLDRSETDLTVAVPEGEVGALAVAALNPVTVALVG